MRILSCQSVCSTTSKTELQGNQNLNNTEMLKRMWTFLEFLPGSLWKTTLYFTFPLLMLSVRNFRSQRKLAKNLPLSQTFFFYCLKLLSFTLCPIGLLCRPLLLSILLHFHPMGTIIDDGSQMKEPIVFQKGNLPKSKGLKVPFNLCRWVFCWNGCQNSLHYYKMASVMVSGWVRPMLKDDRILF